MGPRIELRAGYPPHLIHSTLTYLPILLTNPPSLPPTPDDQKKNNKLKMYDHPSRSREKGRRLKESSSKGVRPGTVSFRYYSFRLQKQFVTGVPFSALHSSPWVSVFVVESARENESTRFGNTSPFSLTGWR